MNNLLKNTFFISTKKININNPNLRLEKLDSYYFGCFSDKFNIKKPYLISFNNTEFIEAENNEYNTALINEKLLKITGSDMNTQAVYYILSPDNQDFVVFNDLFLAKDILTNYNLPVEYDIQKYSSNLTFFKYVNRLKFGEELLIQKNIQNLSIEKRRFSDILNQKSEDYKLEESKNNFFKILEKNIFELTRDESELNISLSGGIDSGAVAYFLSKLNKPVTAYTIATEWGDEYLQAKETADFLGIPLIRIDLTKDDILKEVPELIRFFTFNNSVSIEIALVAFCLYKNLYKNSDKKYTFVTGYGSDLLNAGIFSPFNKYSELHSQIISGLRKTQISNEFSNLAALNYNVKTLHPFWNSSVITEALLIPPDHKVVNNQDKYFFRSMLEGKLNKETVWRKKIGVHQGTGLSTYLKEELEKMDIEIKKDKYDFQDVINEIHKDIFLNGKNIFSNEKLIGSGV